MTEEPYRWLEAIENRREYVRDQIARGTAVFAASVPEGIVLVGVGSGQSKVFEVFDRQALAALGHPADVETVRQSAIDAAHVEAFTRAAEDVTLRRILAGNLSAKLKESFENVFQPPVLGEFLLAELGAASGGDYLARLRYDGSFRKVEGGVAAACASSEKESAAVEWLNGELSKKKGVKRVADLLMQAWNVVESGGDFADLPGEKQRQSAWRTAVGTRVVEIALLERDGDRRVRYRAIARGDLGL
jgi:proteasome alpha subunit